MNFKVEFTEIGAHAIKKLPQNVRFQIKDKLLWLSENAQIMNHKRLKGKYYENVYKLRIGDYRILYTMNKQNKIIRIEFAGNRKDIYK